MDYPAVCIVVLNWNRQDLTLELLGQLKGLDYTCSQIMLVDNDSSDGSPEKVAENFPQVEILRNQENLGAAGGFNSGIEWAVKQGCYKYIWLLDNDVKVESDSLKLLVEVMEGHPNAGLAGPMVLNRDCPELVMEIGGQILWEEASSIGWGKGEPKSQWADRPAFAVDYLPGGCGMLIRTQVLEKIGGLDNRYYFLWEDIDLGLKFKEQGFEVLAVPKAKVYHQDITLARSSPRHRYYSTRNNLLFFFLHTKKAGVKIKSLKRALAAYYLFKAWGLNDYVQAARMGLKDFLAQKSGKSEYVFESPSRPESPLAANEIKGKKFLCFPNSPGELELLSRIAAHNQIVLAVEDYKAKQFADHGYLVIPFKPFALKSLWELFAMASKEKIDWLCTTKEVYSLPLGWLNQFYPLLKVSKEQARLKSVDIFMAMKYVWAFIAPEILTRFWHLVAKNPE